MMRKTRIRSIDWLDTGKTRFAATHQQVLISAAGALGGEFRRLRGRRAPRYRRKLHHMVNMVLAITRGI